MIEEIENDQPICYEPDCNEPGEFYTYPEEYEDVETVDFHETHCYCDSHVGKYGFCFGCRQFWGGVESFEFGDFNISFKLCSECLEEFYGCFDNGDEDYDSDNYDYECY